MEPLGTSVSKGSTKHRISSEAQAPTSDYFQYFSIAKHHDFNMSTSGDKISRLLASNERFASSFTGAPTMEQMRSGTLGNGPLFIRELILPTPGICLLSPAQSPVSTPDVSLKPSLGRTYGRPSIEMREVEQQLTWCGRWMSCVLWSRWTPWLLFITRVRISLTVPSLVLC